MVTGHGGGCWAPIYNPRALTLVSFWPDGAPTHASAIALTEENARGVSVHTLSGTHGSCAAGFAGLVTSLNVRDNTVLLDG